MLAITLHAPRFNVLVLIPIVIIAWPVCENFITSSKLCKQNLFLQNTNNRIVMISSPINFHSTHPPRRVGPWLPLLSSLRNLIHFVRRTNSVHRRERRESQNIDKRANHQRLEFHCQTRLSLPVDNHRNAVDSSNMKAFYTELTIRARIRSGANWRLKPIDSNQLSPIGLRRGVSPSSPFSPRVRMRPRSHTQFTASLTWRISPIYDLCLSSDKRLDPTR